MSGAEMRLIGLRAQVVAVLREIDAMLEEVRAPVESSEDTPIRVMGGGRPGANPEG